MGVCMDPEKFGDFCAVAPINMPPQIDYFANFVAEGQWFWAYVSRPLKTLGGPEYTWTIRMGRDWPLRSSPIYEGTYGDLPEKLAPRISPLKVTLGHPK